MPTKRKRYMVNIPPEIEEAVKLRAKQLNRPIANYLEWLVARDLSGGRVDEDPGAYTVREDAESILTRGAGKGHDASDTTRADGQPSRPKPKGQPRAKGPK